MSWLERFGRSAPRLRYSPLDLPALLRTAVGRRQLRRGITWLAWYFLAPLAWLYRRTWLRHEKVIAVTGTFGKTTTVSALMAALGSPPTTPNFRTHLALGLLRLGRRGAPAVFEVGISRPGQMAAYSRLLHPRVVVVTAVGSEHLTAFGSLERIAREKSRLLAGLGPREVAVLRGDDPRVLAMARETRARVVTYGFGAGHDVRAESLRVDWPHGTRFDLVMGDRRFAALVQPLGRPAVAAALAAVAVAHALGQPPEVTLERLRQFVPTPGRLQPIALPNGAWILRDDYKGEIETIDTALDLLEEIPARRKLVVLGPITEPPHPARAAYRRIGARLGAGVDLVLGCGPYRSAFEALASGARSAGLAREAVTFCSTVEAATARLAAEIAPGDVVLLKGQTNLRFERIALALAGRTVRCELQRCFAGGLACSSCAMLERGWQGLRPVT